MKMALKKIWERITTKLGSFASFLPAVGRQLKVDIEEKNLDGINARLDELDEGADAIKVFTAKTRAAIADGILDAVEGADCILAFETVVDEFEDVAKGYDEDDAPAETRTGEFSPDNPPGAD